MALILETVLENQYMSLKDSINAVSKEAKYFIDEYWSQWQEKNKEISQASYGSDIKFQPGTYAPVIEHIGSAAKKTIVWKDYSPRRKGKSCGSMGQRIKPTQKGYTVSCFPRVRTWELPMILFYEAKLKIYRKSLELLHTQAIELNRLRQEIKSSDALQ